MEENTTVKHMKYKVGPLVAIDFEEMCLVREEVPLVLRVPKVVVLDVSPPQPSEANSP